jgi:predicted Zn-dependent protease
MNFHEIADTVLSSSSRADETEVVYIREDQSLTRFANNHIHQNVSETNFQIVVRCVLGTRIGIVASNDVRLESLRSLAQRACDLAKLQPENPDFKGLPRPSAIRAIDAFDRAVAECSPVRRAGGVGIVCEKALSAGYIAAGSMTTARLTLGVANSHGVFAERDSTIVDGSTVVMSETSSGWAQASGWKLDAVNWESLADEAIGKARIAENPKECEPGDYTVILDPYATSDMVETMAFDGMGALAVQEERSWMNGRIGQRIMAPQVSIVDNGLDPDGIPTPFDFEGQPKQIITIVEDGVCKRPVYDSYTAGREGLQSTGHATPPSPTARYGPLPMDLFLRTGQSSVEEMIRSTERGLYITRFWYTRMVHPRDVVATGMTRDGTLMVRNGEIVGGVKSMRFTQSYVEALAGTSAIGARARVLKSGFGTTTVPAVKLDRFRFTSATR